MKYVFFAARRTASIRLNDPGAPPSGGSSVPASPTMMEQTGSSSGQIILRFWKADWLQNGEAISGDPITDTTAYYATSESNANAEIYSTSQSAGTASTVTKTGLTAGTWYVRLVSTNSAGSSYPSQVYIATVT